MATPAVAAPAVIKKDRQSPTINRAVARYVEIPARKDFVHVVTNKSLGTNTGYDRAEHHGREAGQDRDQLNQAELECSQEYDAEMGMMSHLGIL